MDVQLQVGIGYRDVRALSCLLTELVDNGILHLIADKLRVTEFLGEYHGIHGERLGGLQVLAPVYLHDGIVDIVGAQSLESVDGLQYLDGSAQLEISAIHHLFVTGKRHHATACLHVVGTQLGQFFRQHGLQSHEGLGNQFELLLHCICVILHN